MVAYADHLAVVATAKTENKMEVLVNEALKRITAWKTDHGLKLAPEKKNRGSTFSWKKTMRNYQY